MGILTKSLEVFDAYLDNQLSKAKASNTTPSPAPESPAAYENKAVFDVEYGSEQQWGWKERRGMIGPPIMKNMARKDAMVAAIIQTRISQISQFTKPQEDRFSPGFDVKPVKPADLSREDKLMLANPELTDEEYDLLKYDMEQKRSALQDQQEKDIHMIKQFIMNCGELSPEDSPIKHTPISFDECVRIWIWDRMTYNYSATEFVPTRDGKKLHHWFPVSAGTVRYISRRSAEIYQKTVQDALKMRFARLAKDGGSDEKLMAEYRAEYERDKDKIFKFVQVVQGRVEAAWTDEQLLFQPANPTVDPEDNGYAIGELETLISIVTAHLYAEAHNRNYFTQGIGSKGILHIKGQNLSRGQLEGFKRQWFNQLASTRNAFRPPIIGLADEVKWIELAQSNKDMEFDNWMNYLIRVMCAVYQMDPAEVNFDITKSTTSTLNESNNEERLKTSKDKGMQPLLDYIENIINRHILPKWNKDLASKYKFKFVGLSAETREAEQKRLETETKTWKTLNEARNEMGQGPVEHGDIVLNATYTQFLAQVSQQQTGGTAQDMDGESELSPEENGQPKDSEDSDDSKALFGELDSIHSSVDKELSDKKKADEEKDEQAKKSVTIEYSTDEE